MALKDLHPTTRRYPRTLEEAFPNTVDRAKWFYPPEKNRTLSNLVLGGLGLCMWVGIAYLVSKN